MDSARDRIDVHRRRQDAASLCAACERDAVDLEFSHFVLARDEPRHHARVDGLRAVDDEGDLNVRLGAHHEAAQHLTGSVSGADENELYPVGPFGPTGEIGARCAHVSCGLMAVV